MLYVLPTQNKSCIVFALAFYLTQTKKKKNATKMPVKQLL